jgi:hypothetical protein
MDEVLLQLTTGSDRQLETKTSARLKTLVEADKGNWTEDKIKQLRTIIYDCAFSSLASDFVMKALHVCYYQITGHWTSFYVLKVMGKLGDSYIDKDGNIIKTGEK